MAAKTILLTGASGLVGSALLRALDEHHVISLVHRKPVNGHVVRGDITRPWLGMQLSDYRQLAAEVDLVVHCAALVQFGATPERLHDINVRGVGHIVRFVDDARARLVHCSTAYVTQVADGVALSTYADSKASGETLVRESGLPAAIARISTVIGDSRTGHVSQLQAFHYLLGLALSGRLPFLPGTPTTRIDLLPTDVIAYALAALANQNDATGEYWLTAGGASVPMSRITDIGIAVAADLLFGDVEFDTALLRPRLVEPAICDRVINMALAHTTADAAPSIIQHIGGLMASYNVASEFPTSLGAIPGGPSVPSRLELEKAVEAHCRHLAARPPETWIL